MGLTVDTIVTVIMVDAVESIEAYAVSECSGIPEKPN